MKEAHGQPEQSSDVIIVIRAGRLPLVIISRKMLPINNKCERCKSFSASKPLVSLTGEAKGVSDLTPFLENRVRASVLPSCCNQLNGTPENVSNCCKGCRLMWDQFKSFLFYHFPTTASPYTRTVASISEQMFLFPSAGCGKTNQ